MLGLCASTWQSRLCSLVPSTVIYLLKEPGGLRCSLRPLDISHSVFTLWFHRRQRCLHFLTLASGIQKPHPNRIRSTWQDQGQHGIIPSGGPSCLAVTVFGNQHCSRPTPIDSLRAAKWCCPDLILLCVYLTVVTAQPSGNTLLLIQKKQDTC